jgi:hypothetical protein
MQADLHSSRERGPEAPPVHRGVAPAVKRLLGPMLAGLVIDGLDLVTFGAIGIYTGMILGGAVGYWLAPTLGFPPRGRWLCAIMTGVYCTLPLTGFVPAALIAAGVSRAILRDTPADPSLDPAMRPEGAIDVEYEVRRSDSEPARSRESGPESRSEGTSGAGSHSHRGGP